MFGRFDSTFMKSRCLAARLSVAPFASFVAVVLMASLQARAQDTWTLSSSLSGDWNNLNNWSAGTPTSSVTAYINNGGTANITQLGEKCGTLSLGSGAGSGTVQMTGGNLSAVSYENVGDSGTGTFTQSGGTNNSGSFLQIGNNGGSSGTYNLSGSGQLVAGTEYVGVAGSGSITQSGGTNSITGNSFQGGLGFYLGVESGSSGTYSLGGNGLVSSAFEYVGYSGTGTFTQSGGTNNSGGYLFLGNYTGSNSTYNLSGSGQLLTGTEYVGAGGSGRFTQSGGTNSVSGSLYLGDNGSGTFNLSGTGYLSATGTESVGFSSTGTFTQSGGTNNCGAGLTLGYNPYGLGGNGTYNLSGGLLILPSLIQGSGTAAFNFSGGTLQASSAFSSSLPMTLGNSGGGATFNMAGFAVTLSGPLSGPGSLTKLGSGTLTVTASNSYSGATAIDNGVLSFANGGLGSSGSITLGGSSTLQWYGTNTQDVSSRLAIANGAAATLDTQGNSVVLASDFGGGSTGSLIKVGGGTLTLNGNTTYSGSTAVNAGTLLLDGSNATAAISVAAGATLGGAGSVNAVHVAPGGDVAAGAAGLGSLTVSSLTFSGSGAVSISNVGNYSSEAAIDVTGNNALTANGAATSVVIALSGTAPAGNGIAHLVHYTGAVQGTGYGAFTLSTSGSTFGARAVLALTSTDAGYIDLDYSVDHPVWTGLGNGVWSLAAQSPQNWKLAIAGSATNFLAGDTVVFDDTATGAGTLTVSITAANVAPSAVTFNNNAKNYLLKGPFGITGSASLVLTGSGSVTLANTNSFTGGATINGGLLAFASGGLGSSGNITLSGTSTLQYYGANTQDISSRLVLANGAAATIDTQANNVTFASGLGAGSTASLTKAGAGTLALDASNGYTGGTNIQAGVLQLGPTATLGSPGSPLTLSGGTLTLGGFGTTVGSLSGNSGLIQAAAGYESFLAVNSLANSTYSGNLGDGGGILFLTTTGPATLTLAGVNTYSGSTTVTGGTLKFAALSAFPAGGPVVVSGGTLDAGRLDLTTGAVTLNSGAIIDGTLNATGYSVSAGSIAANLGGSGAALSSGGLVILSGSNTYSGATTISSGTLQVGDGGSGEFLASPSVTLYSAALVFNHSDCADLRRVDQRPRQSGQGRRGHPDDHRRQ